MDEGRSLCWHLFWCGEPLCGIDAVHRDVVAGGLKAVADGEIADTTRASERVEWSGIIVCWWLVGRRRGLLPTSSHDVQLFDGRLTCLIFILAGN